MKYKAHFAGGAIASGIMYEKTFEMLSVEENIFTGIIFVAGAMIGSVLLDIDEENTYITNKTDSNVHKVLRHRGIAHYPIVVTLLLYISYILVNTIPYVGVFIGIFIFGLFVGAVSHFILDTPEGIYWLYPFIRRNIGKITPSKYRKPLKTKVRNFLFDSGFVFILIYSFTLFIQS